MTFAPEDRLLLACAGAASRKDGGSIPASLVRPDLDWEYVLEASIRHAVSPLVYAALRETAQTEVPGLVPPDVYEELRGLYDQTGARSRRLYGVLADIAESFDRAGVPALALKEIPLALRAYPEPALRPIGDLDLLIHAGDYDSAAGALRALGFELVPYTEMPFMRKYATGQHFRRPSDEVWVDLQWNVASREWDLHRDGTFTFDPDTLWADSGSLELARGTLAVPRDEPMLLHLCLHAEGHEYGELVLFADVAALLGRGAESLDWDALQRLARQYGAEASVYYVLLLSQRLLGARVPEEVLDALTPDYLPAGTFKPVFGNLTQLHVSLDEARSLAHPPARVLHDMERTARRQAAAARDLYKEVDAVVRSFKAGGGSLCVIDGAGAERTFPDAALAPFGGLSLVVLEEDAPIVGRTLAERGFEQQGSRPDGVIAYSKSREVVSRDPLLQGRRTTLDIECKLTREWTAEGVANPEQKHAKRHGALAVVRARLRDRESEDEQLRAQLTFLTLPATDALVYLSGKLAAREEGRLFGLLTLLELFRDGSRSADALKRLPPGALALSPGARDSRCAGLAMVEEVLGSELLAPTLDAAGCSSPAPRVLEWARYGPESLQRYADLKRSFFVAYTVLSLNGFRERARYLARALIGGRHHRPFAHAILVDLLRVATAAGRPRTLSTRDLAFWIDRSPGS